ncbi:MAG: hypothetical protein QOD86_985 [Miltoncostaeaceae bacterium]|jgi:hypothetical protein|nr:hypothetical protein [Miltoncostaeaceae bacterium]
MTGPELVALGVAALAALWSGVGGSRLGSVALLVAIEAVILASAFGTALAPDLGWAGALGVILIPYGPAVWIGWAAGTGLGSIAHLLGTRIRRGRPRGAATAG